MEAQGVPIAWGYRTMAIRDIMERSLSRRANFRLLARDILLKRIIISVVVFVDCVVEVVLLGVFVFLPSACHWRHETHIVPVMLPADLGLPHQSFEPGNRAEFFFSRD